MRLEEITERYGPIDPGPVANESRSLSIQLPPENSRETQVFLGPESYSTSQLFTRPLGDPEIWQGTIDDNSEKVLSDVRSTLAEMSNAVFISEEEGLPLEVVTPLLPFYEQRYSNALLGEEFKSPVTFREKTGQLLLQEDLDRYAGSPSERVERTKTYLTLAMNQPGYGIAPPELSPDGLSIDERLKRIHRKNPRTPQLSPADEGQYLPPQFQDTESTDSLQRLHRLHQEHIAQWRLSLITPDNITQRAIQQVNAEDRPIDSVIGNHNFRAWASEYYQVKVPPPGQSIDGKSPVTDPNIRRLAEEWLLSQPGSGDIIVDHLFRSAKGAVANTGGSVAGSIGVALTAAGMENAGQYFIDLADGTQVVARDLTDPRQDHLITANIAETAGGMAAFVIPGTLVARAGRLAGLGETSIALAATATTATVAATENSFHQYQLAIESGASQDDATLVAGLAALVGATGAIPAAQWALRLERSGPALQILYRMAVETAEATIQGSGQELANNVIAQQTYDKNRAALEGVADAAALNASAASILSLLTSIAAQAKAKQPAIKYDDRKGPLIVDQNNELASPGDATSPPAKPPTGNDLPSPQDPGLPKESPPARPNSSTSPDSQGNPYRNTDGTLILPDNWPKPKSEAEAEALQNFLELVSNVELADQKYNQIPDASGGKVIGTDAARELFPEYATREGKIQFTDITTIPGSIYAKDRIWREINNPNGRNKLLVMAGGVGAGKSTVLTDKLQQDYDLVIDGTLRDKTWASDTFKQALNTGWEIDVRYVQRPLNSVAEGVISRSNETGRTFSLTHLFTSHRDAQSSFLSLAHEFAADPQIRFIPYYTSDTKTDTKPSIIELTQIDAGGPLSYSYRYDDRRREKEMAQGHRRSDARSIDASEQSRISEAFERAVRSGKFEDRILRRLASKDPELERIFSQYWLPPRSGSDRSDGSSYGRVIRANLASLGRHLADQSRTFSDAAEAAEPRGSNQPGEGASSAGSGRNVAAWAVKNGKIIPESQFEDFTFISGSTSEHTVYYRKSDDRVVKRTRDLYYGQVPSLDDGQIVSVDASPAEYLRRMSLQMVVFNTDFRLEGVTIPKESLYLDDPAEAPQIVVSQPWIESKRAVSQQDVGRFLSKEGFVPVPHSFYCWVRPADGVVVLDASPDNFIMSSEGLVPIDLQINVFTPTQLREAGFNVIWDE